MLNSSAGRWAVYVATFFFAFGFGIAVAEVRLRTVGESNEIKVRPVVQPSVSITTTTLDAAFTDIAFRGDSTLFGAGSFAGLQRSNDLGHTWSRINIDTGGWLIRTVDFVDDQTGWAAGDHTLMKTEDGGETWTRRNFPGWLHNAEIDFVDRNVGYTAATDCSPKNDQCTGMKVMKTVDGGQTWRTVYQDASYVTVFQVKAIDRDTAFVLSGGSVVRRTIDGGTTWEVTYNNRNAAYKMASSPDGVIWLSGEHSLMRSVDKGLTWQNPAQLSPGFLSEKWHAIGFSATRLGVVAGDGSCIGITFDSGRSWSKYCSDKIKFGLMFDIEIHENRAIISSSSDTAHDSISRLRLVIDKGLL
jgi:photosystem II stability/assembly factor-like uncharacterized protein